MICAVVIQKELNILTKKPCRKYFEEHCFAMMYAQIIKIGSQNINSILPGIQNTVAIAITSPNKESCKINFQFIFLFLIGEVLNDWLIYIKDNNYLHTFSSKQNEKQVQVQHIHFIIIRLSDFERINYLNSF